MADYLTTTTFPMTAAGYAERDRQPLREWTAEEHRREARRQLLWAAGGDTANRLAAAQVHATLAESLADHSHPHTHGPVR
ncbi:hypothetical protein [Saccharothrix deserti]|uniref:hypothetical protein n=1 Tax=Saccharothrix deserti TaxID=2593674 RepID=UPI00131EB5CB|nr:hypothetical protein [Saccharothrix deserti]